MMTRPEGGSPPLPRSQVRVEHRLETSIESRTANFATALGDHQRALAGTMTPSSKTHIARDMRLPYDPRQSMRWPVNGSDLKGGSHENHARSPIYPERRTCRLRAPLRRREC